MRVSLFEKGNVGQKQRNYDQCEGNCSFNVDIFDANFGVFHRSYATSLLNKTDAIRASIPEPTLMLNIHNLSFGFLDCSGTMNAAPNHPAERLMNKSEKATSQRGAEFSIKNNLAYLNMEGSVG